MGAPTNRPNEQMDRKEGGPEAQDWTPYQTRVCLMAVLCTFCWRDAGVKGENVCKGELFWPIFQTPPPLDGSHEPRTGLQGGRWGAQSGLLPCSQRQPRLPPQS